MSCVLHKRSLNPSLHEAKWEQTWNHFCSCKNYGLSFQDAVATIFSPVVTGQDWWMGGWLGKIFIGINSPQLFFISMAKTLLNMPSDLWKNVGMHLQRKKRGSQTSVSSMPTATFVEGWATIPTSVGPSWVKPSRPHSLLPVPSDFVSHLSQWPVGPRADLPREAKTNTICQRDSHELTWQDKAKWGNWEADSEESERSTEK